MCALYILFDGNLSTLGRGAKIGDYINHERNNNPAKITGAAKKQIKLKKKPCQVTLIILILLSTDQYETSTLFDLIKFKF